MVLANIGPDDEVEFNRWYDREHMRERVEVPGFISARRYVSDRLSRWKYLALYETEGVSTFRSSVYRQALANQSAWSKQMLARFRDPQRSVAERTCRIGYGIGATVMVTRLRPRTECAEALRRSLSADLLPRLASQAGVIEASLIECDPVLSKPVAEYPTGGLDVVKPDDWFVLVGRSDAGQTALDVAGAQLEFLVETVEQIGCFSLLWDLHRSDL